MIITKEEAIEYLKENIDNASEKEIINTLERYMRNREIEEIDVKGVTRVMENILEDIEISKDMPSYNIGSEMDTLKETVDNEEPNELNSEYSPLEDLIRDSDKYLKTAGVVSIISLVTFFPVSILGKLFGVNIKFVAIAVLLVTLVYIGVKSIIMFREDREKNLEINKAKEVWDERTGK